MSLAINIPVWLLWTAGSALGIAILFLVFVGVAVIWAFSGSRQQGW